MMSTDTPRQPSRRALVGAAAWSIPVLTLAVAAPAAAASAVSPGKLELANGLVIWADASGTDAGGNPQYPYAGRAGADTHKSMHMRFFVDLSNTGGDAIAAGTVLVFTLAGGWTERVLRTAPSGIVVTSATAGSTVTVTVSSAIPVGWTGRFDFSALAPLVDAGQDTIASPFTASAAVLPPTGDALSAQSSFSLGVATQGMPGIYEVSLPLGHPPVASGSNVPGAANGAYLTGLHYTWEITFGTLSSSALRGLDINFQCSGVSDVRVESSTVAIETSGGALATTAERFAGGTTKQKIVVSGYLNPITAGGPAVLSATATATITGDGKLPPAETGPYTGITTTTHIFAYKN